MSRPPVQNPVDTARLAVLVGDLAVQVQSVDRRIATVAEQLGSIERRLSAAAPEAVVQSYLKLLSELAAQVEFYATSFSKLRATFGELSVTMGPDPSDNITAQVMPHLAGLMGKANPSAAPGVPSAAGIEGMLAALFSGAGATPPAAAR